MATRKDVNSINYFIKMMEEDDIETLFINQIEKNAASPDSKSSGVGLISMMKDYDAKIGIKINPINIGTVGISHFIIT